MRSRCSRLRQLSAWSLYTSSVPDGRAARAVDTLAFAELANCLSDRERVRLVEGAAESHRLIPLQPCVHMTLRSISPFRARSICWVTHLHGHLALERPPLWTLAHISQVITRTACSAPRLLIHGESLGTQETSTIGGMTRSTSTIESGSCAKERASLSASSVRVEPSSGTRSRCDICKHSPRASVSPSCGIDRTPGVAAGRSLTGNARASAAHCWLVRARVRC